MHRAQPINQWMARMAIKLPDSQAKTLIVSETRNRASAAASDRRSEAGDQRCRRGGSAGLKSGDAINFRSRRISSRRATPLAARSGRAADAADCNCWPGSPPAKPLSGAGLADEAGLTRAAIWKQIEALRAAACRSRRAARPATACPGRCRCSTSRRSAARLADGAAHRAGRAGGALGARLHVQRIAAPRCRRARLERRAGRNPDRRSWPSRARVAVAAGAESLPVLPEALRVAGLPHSAACRWRSGVIVLRTLDDSGHRRCRPEMAERCAGHGERRSAAASWAASWSSSVANTRGRARPSSASASICA